MKLPRLFTLASLLAVGAFVAPLHAASPVSALVLENGGFESASTGWLLVNAVSTSAVIGEAGARSGKLGFTISDQSDTFFARAESDAMPTAPGRACRLDFWARTHSPGTYGGISVRFYATDGRVMGDPSATHVQAVDTAGAWKQFGLTAVAPAGAATVKLLIHTYSRQEGVVDFDDIEFRDAAGDGSAPPAATAAAAPVAAALAAALVPRGAKGLYIVIKADDLVVQAGQVPPRWAKFAAYLRERGIKSSIGIITHSLVADNPAYFDWIKEHHASGLVEFWHHGHSHRQWKENGLDVYEFKGPTLEQQREQLAQGQRLARARLGFAFQTFGAPFNATDANTAAALAEDTDIVAWLYGDKAAPAGKSILERDWGANIENPIFVPNPEKFAAGYEAASVTRRYLVVPGHPAQWDDARFANFTRIIDFLVAQEARFVTPMELVAALKL